MPLPGALSIYPGEQVRAYYRASASPTRFRALARVEHTTGWETYSLTDYDTGAVTAFTTDRTEVSVAEAPTGGGTGGCIVTGGGMEAIGGALKRGQFYARFVVTRAGLEECLCCGYLSDSYPFIPIGEHTEPGPGGGEGFLRTVTGSNPAAGAEILETVPANAVWRLRSFGAVYVAAATVFDRSPRLIIDDGATANRLYVAHDDGANPIQSGETRTIFWRAGVVGETGSYAVNDFVDTDTLNLRGVLPQDLYLSEANRIRTVTVNIQATDNIAAPIFQVEEWLVL